MRSGAENGRTGGIDRGREIDRRVAAVLVGGWAGMAVAALTVADISSMHFLGLPLSAYLAGQGALMGVVIVGVRVARDI